MNSAQESNSLSSLPEKGKSTVIRAEIYKHAREQNVFLIYHQ